MVYPEFASPEKSWSARNGHYHNVVAENISDDESLRLIGTTKFEPRSDIKNVLITGGAGFM